MQSIIRTFPLICSSVWGIFLSLKKSIVTEQTVWKVPGSVRQNQDSLQHQWGRCMVLDRSTSNSIQLCIHDVPPQSRGPYSAGQNTQQWGTKEKLKAWKQWNVELVFHTCSLRPLSVRILLHLPVCSLQVQTGLLQVNKDQQSSELITNQAVNWASVADCILTCTWAGR